MNFNIQVVLIIITLMDMEKLYLIIMIRMKANFQMESFMEKENIHLLKVEIQLDNLMEIN